MQPVQDVSSIRLLKFYCSSRIDRKDIQAWTDLLAEDAVGISICFCLGLPERLEGKPAIYNYMKNVIAQMQNYECS